MKLKLSPTPKVRVVLLMVTFDGADFTVTVQVTSTPLKASTVIMAVPFFSALKTPGSTYFKTDFLFERHTISFEAVPEGIEALSLNVSPTPTVILVLLIDISGGSGRTVTFHFAEISSTATVIYAVPSETAFIIPFSSTVAIFSSEE